MNRKQLLSNYASSIVSGIIMAEIARDKNNEICLSTIYDVSIRKSFFLAKQMLKTYDGVIEKVSIKSKILKLTNILFSIRNQWREQHYRKRVFKLSINNCIKNKDFETVKALRKAM